VACCGLLLCDVCSVAVNNDCHFPQVLLTTSWCPTRSIAA
jgi:hypothetical protein